MVKGILRLTSENPFSEWEEMALKESGVEVKAEPKKKPVSLQVRFRIWGCLPENTGKLLLVHNYADLTRYLTKDGRPAGWGIPGGEAKGNETPYEALLHEQGEIGHPIYPETKPVFAYRFERECRRQVTEDTGKRLFEWVEHIYIFEARIEEDVVIERTPEERQEIDDDHFFSIEEVAKKQSGVFRSHSNMVTAWYQSRGWRFCGGRICDGVFFPPTWCPPNPPVQT